MGNRYTAKQKGVTPGSGSGYSLDSIDRQSPGSANSGCRLPAMEQLLPTR